MRRLLAGLLSLLVTAVVGGVATVLGVRGAIALTGSGHQELFRDRPAGAAAGALLALGVSVLIVILAGGLGARAGEWTLARLGHPPARPDPKGVPFIRRLGVSLAAFVAGFGVGGGWIHLWLWAVALDVPGVERIEGLPFIMAAGPALGLAMVRAVMRRGLRAPTGSPAGEGARAEPDRNPRTVEGGA